LSFDLDNYGVPLHKEPVSVIHPVWYGIPNRDEFSASSILQGLQTYEDHVLWFQHEFGIWRKDDRFIEMLRELDNIKKVVSFHSLHFQSSETPYGLRKQEYSLLCELLPNTDAITVFSNGVYNAVVHAFPDYKDKVHVLKHGVHLYPKVSSMSREAAKLRIYEYLVDESGLEQKIKDKLIEQRVFLDDDMTVIGSTGFITASKGTKLLYQAYNDLHHILPQKKIAVVHIGSLRETNSSIDNKYAVELKTKTSGEGQFLLEIYIPADILPLMLRALDIYFYWPSDCTQSGILAHALGTGAVISCKDMEGVGETVKVAGGLACTEFEQQIANLKALILSPELRLEMSEKAMKYANTFSWKNQALQHYKLSEQLASFKLQPLAPTLHLTANLIPSIQVSQTELCIDSVAVALPEADKLSKPSSN